MAILVYLLTVRVAFTRASLPRNLVCITMADLPLEMAFAFLDTNDLVDAKVGTDHARSRRTLHSAIHRLRRRLTSRAVSDRIIVLDAVDVKA